VEGRCDLPGHVALNGEQVLRGERHFVALGPELILALRIRELDAHPYLAPGPLHAALEHRADAPSWSTTRKGLGSSR